MPAQGLQELQKAQRATRLESGWEKELPKLEKVVDFTLEYSQGIIATRDVNGRNVYHPARVYIDTCLPALDFTDLMWVG